MANEKRILEHGQKCGRKRWEQKGEEGTAKEEGVINGRERLRHREKEREG